MEFFGSILSYILLYKYFALFVIVFAGAFIFFVVPGNAILLAAGAFASQGYMNGFLVFLCAFVANISADAIGFYLTRIYGAKIMRALHINRGGKFAKVEHYLTNYAFGTVFLTRIAGPFAPTVNFVAGFIGVSFKKFLTADVLGNLVDIGFFVGAGYVLGNYWEAFLNDTWIFGFLCFIAFIIYLFAKSRWKKIIL